jgi:hypothetical protein
MPTLFYRTIILTDCSTFRTKPTTEMAGGFAYIEKNGDWILENKKDHIRGAFKAYRNLFFKQMGGLKKAAMGWDTVDDYYLLYGWK